MYFVTRCEDSSLEVIPDADQTHLISENHFVPLYICFHIINTKIEIAQREITGSNQEYYQRTRTYTQRPGYIHTQYQERIHNIEKISFFFWNLNYWHWTKKFQSSKTKNNPKIYHISFVCPIFLSCIIYWIFPTAFDCFQPFHLSNKDFRSSSATGHGGAG